MNKIAVIMAGGLGARLWPRSTEKTPKQFIHLLGDGTMIQNTVARLQPLFSNEEIYIVAPEAMDKIIEDQLPAIPRENIILEPFAKNTAPCLALTDTIIGDRFSPDTVMVACPSDHVIYNVREFHQSLEVATQYAWEKKGIVTIGIQPTRPETSFGYIQVRDERKDLGEYYDNGVRYTTTFAEKPDVATAGRFIESGDFLWNSGIFIWRLDTFREAFEQYLPEQDRLFKILKKFVNKGPFRDVTEDIYRQMQGESVDYAILEKANNVFVVESSFSWTDLGTWDELYRLSMKDARNNVIEGDVIAVNTSNCLVNSSNKLIGIVGVDNLIVIDSNDALLICKRGHTEDVKEIVDFIRRKHINKFL